MPRDVTSDVEVIEGVCRRVPERARRSGNDEVRYNRQAKQAECDAEHETGGRARWGPRFPKHECRSPAAARPSCSKRADAPPPPREARRLLRFTKKAGQRTGARAAGRAAERRHNARALLALAHLGTGGLPGANVEFAIPSE